MSEGMPQFSTAEYAKAGEVPCRVCGKTVSGPFYRINGQTACPNCTELLRAKFPQDSHAAFVRGLLFGSGAAIAGLILYTVVGVVTGLNLGLVSLAVGFMVGKAMVFGSRGVRGRRYQIAAAILTYFAVSLSTVAIGVGVGQPMGLLTALVMGLASPFLELYDPMHGLIGLVILFVGLNIAWRLTAGRRLEVVGPLREAPPQPASP